MYFREAYSLQARDRVDLKGTEEHHAAGARTRGNAPGAEAAASLATRRGKGAGKGELGRHSSPG